MEALHIKYYKKVLVYFSKEELEKIKNLEIKQNNKLKSKECIKLIHR